MESSQTCPPCSAGPAEEVRALCRREGGEGRGRGEGEGEGEGEGKGEGEERRGRRKGDGWKGSSIL